MPVRLISCVLLAAWGCLAGCGQPAPSSDPAVPAEAPEVRTAPAKERAAEVVALPSDPAARAKLLDAWFARAKEHAFKVAEKDEIAPAWGTIATQYALLGRWDEALETASRSRHEGRRGCDVRDLVLWAALDGETVRAIELAKRIEVPSSRALALVQVAREQAERHEFAGAERTLELLADEPSWLIAGREEIAKAQAEAGQYAAARATAAKIVPETDEDRQDLQELLKLIDQCEAEGRRDPPKQRKDRAVPLVQSGREGIGMAGEFDETTDLRDAEIRADLPETGDLRGTRWRQIAWAYFERGDHAACRRAIKSALEHVEKTKHPAVRAVERAALAGLFLELGEEEAARSLVRKATEPGPQKAPKGDAQAETTTNVLSGFVESFITMGIAVPYIVGVQVRCGEIDEAVNLVDQYPDEFGVWASFAAYCAASGRLAEVEKRIEAAESEEVKLQLCVGVIEALRRRDK